MREGNQPRDMNFSGGNEAAPHTPLFEGQQGPFFNPENPQSYEVMWGEEAALAGIIDDLVGHDEPWPEIELEFNDHNLFGSELIPATRESRYRHVFMAIEKSAPNSLERPDRQIASLSLAAVHRYLNLTNSINGHPWRRSEMLDPDLVVSTLRQALNKLNDPVDQALQQIESDYAGKFTDKVMKQLEEDVVLGTKQVLVIDIYQKFIGQFKKAYLAGIVRDSQQ